MADFDLSKKYEELLLKLLPEGEAWRKDLDSNNRKFSRSISGIFAYLESRAERLLNEIDPRTAHETLSDWERFLNIPDDCITPEHHSTMGLQERRDAVTQRLITGGGASAQFFQNIATQLGYPDIRVSEFRPFRAGSRAGDRLTAGLWRYFFLVSAPATLTRKFRAGSQCGERLQKASNTVIENMINKLKPAHTTAIFSYGGE